MSRSWVAIFSLNALCIISIGIICCGHRDWVFFGMLLGVAASVVGMLLKSDDAESRTVFQVFLMWLVLIFLLGMGSILAALGSMR